MVTIAALAKNFFTKLKISCNAKVHVASWVWQKYLLFVQQNFFGYTVRALHLLFIALSLQ